MPTGHPSYSLKTLGLPSIRDSNGELIDFPLGKPFALLSYIVLADRLPTRDNLASLLWPQVPRANGLQSVRQALHLIKRILGDVILESDYAISIVPGSIECDTVRLRRELTAGKIDVASELYTGPFLDRFTLPSVPDWAEWVDRMRQRTERALADALERAATREAVSGRADVAENYLRRLLHMDAYRAETHAHLIEVLLATGAIADAGMALSDARAAMPEAEFQELWDQLSEKIRNRPATAERRQQNLLHSGTTDDAVIWQTVRSGRAALLYFSSDDHSPRLEQIVAHVQADGGACVLFASTIADRHSPFESVLALARQLLQLPGAAGISNASHALLRSLLSNSVAVVEPIALSDALSDLIAAVAYEKPCMVGIQDFQWTDEGSRSVLSRAIRDCSTDPVLFVLTARAGSIGLVVTDTSTVFRA